MIEGQASADPMAPARPRRDLYVNILFWGVLAVLAVLYLLQMLAYSPTQDPDPDGYVTYANHLRENGNFIDYKRLPGYPYFILAVDVLSPAPIATDVYFVQIGLSLAMFIGLALLIARHFGRGPALLTAAIFAIKSLFAFISTIMLADFLSVLFAQLILFMGILVFRSTHWRIGLALLGFFVAVSVGIAVHTSLIWIALSVLIGLGLVWIADRVLPWKFASVSFRKYGIYRTAGLAITAIGSYLVVLAILVPPHPGKKPEFQRFYDGYAAYYMTMCLAPQGEPIDADIEASRAQIEAALGYPPERSRHPHMVVPVWVSLLEKHPELFPDFWRERAMQNPISFLGCAYNEVHSRYHDMIENFYPFASERVLVNTFRPKFNAQLANKMYWITGIYVPDMDDSKGLVANSAAFGVELLRVLGFLAALVGGAFLFARKFPELSGALFLGMFGWMAAVSMMLVLDARYLITFAPFIYFCEALAIWWVLTTVRRWVLALIPSRTRAKASSDASADAPVS